MNALRVVVADDEPLVRERIADLVRDTDGIELVGVAANGLEALNLITQLEPELVFLDVEMPELGGFGVIGAIDAERLPGVVFVTAFERYAVDAFDAGAIDYLHKPVTRQRFQVAVARARERLERRTVADAKALVEGAADVERQRGGRGRFVVRRGTTHYFVAVDEVDWIDVADNYLRLHTGARVHLHRGTMKQAEHELDPARFVRIHRSVMVAIDRIRAVRAHALGGHVLELKSGIRLRGSRQYAARVRSLMR